jgi:acylphosphatase
MNTRLCVQATIHGKVQGVGYRNWTVQNAQTRGLSGWVRNRTDGTVEALFCGDESRVEDMLHACKTGPMAARVSQVERKMPDIPPPAGFTQRPTE